MKAMLKKLAQRTGILDYRLNKSSKSYQNISYSQCGEDLIIDFILSSSLKVSHPYYLDIGAHHPFYLSNTYHFYEKGNRGVLIEPDPELFSVIESSRAEDKCINAGVGAKSGKATFYVMTSSTLNTFSKVEAERYSKHDNIDIKETIELPIVSMDSIFSKYCKKKNFDVVTVDVEGMDFEIISAIDYKRYRPKILCVETLTYEQDGTGKKIQKTIDYIKSQNYFVYADTFINTIFIDNEVWQDMTNKEKTKK